MIKPIIEVKNISKKYALGKRQPYYSFRDTISGILHTPFKRENLEKDEFWALKDVSFDINEGDVVGVIGRNGAGKSTLLKILSQITPPTEGEINLRGRVASLLEVGTGFHPELTGKENIYLNGAILGMKRREINKKFNEIVEFAEIEKFLDTPVKHYSSGMYMRLAFSVAAHLEPDILLVDEVLAVGDAEFQRKCLGKMDEISKNNGRTVIFVSHNLAAIRQLCKKSILLENGSLIMFDDTEKVITKYLEPQNKYLKEAKTDKNKNILCFKEIVLHDENHKIKESFECDEEISIVLKIKIDKTIPGLYGYMTINKNDGTIVLETDSTDYGLNSMDNLRPGNYEFIVNIPKRSISPGKYYINLSFSSSYGSNSEIDQPGIVTSFSVEDNRTIRGNNRKGYFSSIINWKKSNGSSVKG